MLPVLLKYVYVHTHTQDWKKYAKIMLEEIHQNNNGYFLAM